MSYSSTCAWCRVSKKSHFYALAAWSPCLYWLPDLHFVGFWQSNVHSMCCIFELELCNFVSCRSLVRSRARSWASEDYHTRDADDLTFFISFRFIYYESKRLKALRFPQESTCFMPFSFSSLLKCTKEWLEPCWIVLIEYNVSNDYVTDVSSQVAQVCDRSHDWFLLKLPTFVKFQWSSSDVIPLIRIILGFSCVCSSLKTIKMKNNKNLFQNTTVVSMITVDRDDEPD